jgi:hypothetical protein
MVDGISRADLDDADFKDAVELASDGSTVYRSFTVVSTTSGTKMVVISGDNLLYKDNPPETGDTFWLTGSTAADGYYSFDAVVDETSFTVIESISSSTGGTGSFIYKSGATYVGVSVGGLTNLASSDNTVQKALAKLDSTITADRDGHSALRQLIHLADEGGPFEGFASGTYCETTGTVFPTAVVWWESSAKLKKIVENTATYNNNGTIATLTWKSYDGDGVLKASFTDTISYSGVFETSRTRTIN